MAKKIMILMSIVIMMTLLSGLNTIRINIHNVWIGTNDDLIIYCQGFPPGWQTQTIVQGPDIDNPTQHTYASVITSSSCTITQGNRSVTFTLPDESAGINEIDVTLPGPWQKLPQPKEER